MTWPPPIEADTTWREVWLSAGRKVDLRQVQLWGSPVWIDAEGDVFCDGCLAMHTTAELVRDGSHTVSPSFAAQPMHFPLDAGPRAPQEIR